MQGLGLLIQIALLVAWYTVAPTLPWWLVFMPLLLGAACLGALLVGCLIGMVVALRS
jgi:hypothetical protein